MGTTTDKLNRLTQTKSDLKTVINYAGGNIVDETTFKEYPKKLHKAYIDILNNGTDDLYDALPKTTEEGISADLDTEQGKMKININSTNLIQNGTPTPDNPQDVHVITGKNSVNIHNKNLFNPSLIQEYTHSMGVTISKNNDLITIQGTNDSSSAHAARLIGDNDYFLLKAGVTYTIRYITGQSASTSTYRMDMRQYNNAGNIYKYESGTKGMTYTPETDLKVAFYVRLGANYTINTSGYIQIEIGSTATDYVPHQEQNYPISLSSKNLFSVTYSGNYGFTYTYNNGVYTLTPSVTNPSITFQLVNPIPAGTYYYSGGHSNLISFRDTNNANITTLSNVDGVITTTEPIYYIRYNYVATIGEEIILDLSQTQLEEGSTATTYEPYYNLEYCNITDYADQFFKNTLDSELYDSTLLENEWYLKKNIKKFVLDGNVNKHQYSFADDLSNVSVVTILANKVDKSLIRVLGKETVISDKFIYIQDGSNREHILISAAQSTEGGYFGNFRLFINHDRLSGYSSNLTNNEKLQLMINYLQTNNVVAYSLVRYPEYIHISQEDYPTLKAQLEAIYNNVKSYEDKTYITQTNDDLPFTLDISALAKIE